MGMFPLSGAPSTTFHFVYHTSVHFGLLHFVHISLFGTLAIARWF